MIKLGKHVSTEVPPTLPYFGKAPSSKETGTQPAQLSSPKPVALSPGKRTTLRSEFIDQLGKWYSLSEKGVITQSKYEQLQETILGDMSTL